MKPNIIVLIVLHICQATVCTLKDSDYKQLPELFSLDDYDFCMGEDDGVYCLAQFELFASDDNHLYEIIKEHAKDITKHYNYSKIDRGICLNHSCKQYVIKNNIEDTVDLSDALAKCVNETMWKKYHLSAKLAFAYYCDRPTEEINQTDFLDWTIIGVFAAICLLNLIGSFYDVKMRNVNKLKQNTVGNKYLLSFSLFQNWRSLMTLERKDSWSESLKELLGIRCIITFIIIYAHMTLLVITGFVEDPQNFEKTYDDSPVYYLLFNGLMIVQVFFFLSGFTLTYFLKIYAEKQQLGWSSVPKILLIRWCRLTPVCAIMVAFLATWFRFLGSGPLWKLASTSGPTADCRNYWWSHLLHVNNLIPRNKYCLIPSWHIAADTQMFIIGLIVHFATRNRGRVQTLKLLLLFGMLAPAIHTWLFETGALVVLTPELLRIMLDDTYYYVHNRGYMNLPCFLLGMGTGYVGYDLQRKGVDLSRNMVLRFLSWWIVPLFIGVIYSGRIFFYPEARGSVAARVLYAATHRGALGLLGVAWVLGIICKCNDLSRILFNHRGWAVMSKLSYCVFLFHIVFLHIIFGNRRELPSISFTTVGIITAAVIVVSYIVAVPMHLMIEAPVNRLIKAVVNDQSVEEKKSS